MILSFLFQKNDYFEKELWEALVITKKILHDLVILMIGFGMIIAIAFPFFGLITGTPASYVLTPLFFELCILAGSLVGIFNIFLSKKLSDRKSPSFPNT